MPNSLDDVLQRYRDYGSQSQAPLPPPALSTNANPVGIPQYTIPNAFQTPVGSVSMYKTMSSQNEYEGQVASRFASQSAMYHDPSSAAGNIRSRKGRQFGESWGGAIGSVAGMAGGAGGSFAGGAIGDMFGGDIGGALGRPLGWMGDLFSGNLGARERQGQFMHQATGLQQATQGRLMLGAGEAGLGGGGMNLQTAGKLAQRIAPMGQQEGMSKQDMTSLTRAAGELNFLDQATNSDQIFETIKKLTKVVGVMGKITGDPDIMRNLKEISNLRAVGLNINQAVQATEQIDMAARGMGMDRFQAMTSAGAAGMGMAQRAGLTGGVGMVQGVGAGALARMGSAGLNERQLALAGGVQGLAGTMMQQNMQFAQGPGNLMMLSGLSQGAGGEFGLRSGFGQELQGKGSFAGRLQSGLSNVRSPGQLIQFLGQQRELQTEMMEQLGPFGAQMSQARLIEDLSRQMGGANQRESVLLAASMVTGSPEKGLTLMRTLGSKQFKERAGGLIGEQQKRARFAGDIEAVSERRTRETARTQRQRRARLGRGGVAAWLGEATGYLDEEPESMGSVAEMDEAIAEEQEAQDRIADEQFETATGLERTTKRARGPSLARPVERERKRAEKMLKAGWKVAGLSRSGKELGGYGVEFDYDEKSKTVRIKPGKHVELRGGGLFGDIGFVEAEPELTSAERTGADMFMGGEAATAGLLGGVGEWAANMSDRLGMGSLAKDAIKGQRQRALGKLQRTGKRIQEVKRSTEKQWHAGLRKMGKSLGAGSVAALDQAAIQYAKSLDGSGKGVDADVLYDKMVRAFAKSKGITYAEASDALESQRENLVRTGMKFIEESGDPAALDALKRSADAAGVVDAQGMSKDDLERFRKDADTRMLSAMKELGFAEKDTEDIEDVSGEQRAAFDTFRGLSGEDQALAMGIIAKEGGTAAEGVTTELAKLRTSDPKRYSKVAAAARKMKGAITDKDEQARLATKAGRTTEAYGGLKGFEEMMEAGKSGTGMLRGMKASKDVSILEKEMQKRGMSEVSYEGEGVTGGTEESRKKVSELEKKKEQLESMSDIFGDFPEATKDLKEATNNLNKAVDEMNRKVHTPWPGN